MMNKKELPHIITAVSFVVFIVLGLACATTPSQWKDVSYNGEDSKFLEQTAWIFNTTHRWLSSRYNPIKVEFHPNGKLDFTQFTGSDWRKSSWERVGTDIKLVFSDGYFSAEGKYNSDDFTISGTLHDSDGSNSDFTMEFINSFSAQRYVDGFDTALYGYWRTLGGADLSGTPVDYEFFAGNFITYSITYKIGGGGDRASTDKLERGTYTTDDKGTLTFKVTHTYDRTEKIFLSKDEFTARYKAQGKTVEQINSAIKEYYPDRSVKYSIGGAGGLYVVGWGKQLDIKENIPRHTWFVK